MYLRSIILLAIVTLYISGCGEDGHIIDNSTAPVKIEFRLAPNAPSQANLTRMELTVSSPDIDEPLLFPITNINTEARTARGSITVPAGNMSFFVKAFEGDCPAFSGTLENVEITPDRASPVTIRLDTIPIVIGIRSAQDRVNVGNNYVLELYIEDAPRLFSFTCELGFHEDLLQPVEIVPGDFFGGSDDFLFVEDSQLPRNQRNRLSLGITRLGDDAGVCGSGVLFRMTFRAIAAGDAIINLLRNDMLTLITPEPDSAHIEDSRISIGAGAVVRID